jgi:tRNA nucleotidyltransferase (CCA-adding enzyme)
MEEKFKALLTNEIKQLHTVLGIEADLHIVGGAIRDVYLNKKPKDIDLATLLEPNVVVEKLENAGITCVPIGIRRGTVAAVIEFETIEITTFRNPQNEKLFVDNIVTDLAARDFTINAMAYSLNTLELIDPYNGLNDLLNNLVTCVGDPKLRFTEDPHRMLRFVRFCYAKGFNPDPVTEAAVKELAPLLSLTSGERIRMELLKILVTPNVVLAFQKLHELGLLQVFLPELSATVGVTQNDYHIYDVFNHTLKVVENCEPDPLLRMAALLHDIAKPQARTVAENGIVHFYGHDDLGKDVATEILYRLKFSSIAMGLIIKLIHQHMREIPQSLKATRKIIKEWDYDLDYWVSLKKADLLGGKVDKDNLALIWDRFDLLRNQVEEEQFITKFKLNIGGNDLIALGMKEGPEIGKVLKALEDKVMESPELNTKEDLLELATKLL